MQTAGVSVTGENATIALNDPRHVEVSLENYSARAFSPSGLMRVHITASLVDPDVSRPVQTEPSGYLTAPA